MTIKRNRTLRRGAAREARKLMRGGMAAGLVVLGACSDSHVDSPDMSMASDGGSSDANISGGGFAGSSSTSTAGASGGAGTSAARVDAGVANRSDPNADVVTSNTIARNVLYSWTSSAQLVELRETPVLCTRSEMSDGTRTQLSTVIAELAAAGDPLAQVLATPQFQKGRYAWSNAWATVRGWPDESYGDQLLRIELKPEAWIAVVERGTTRVIDLNNQMVIPNDALAHPERIAAVYFLNAGDADPNACGTFASGCGTGAYREYFINNESMVLRWSFGAQAILDEIERSIDLIQALRDEIAIHPDGSWDACNFSRSAYCSWLDGGSLGHSSARLEAYRLSLALTSDLYVPTLDKLDALIDALNASVFVPDPFEHMP